MTATAKQIFDQALELDPRERSELIARLLDTVDGAPEVGYEEAWAAEIKARLEDIDAGRVTMIPAEESIRRARQRAGME